MTRSTLLLVAVLLSAAPALSQTSAPPTEAQIDRLEANLDDLVRDSSRAIRDFRALENGASQTDLRDSLLQNVGQINTRISALRIDLGRAYDAQRVAATPPAAGRQVDRVPRGASPDRADAPDRVAPVVPLAREDSLVTDGRRGPLSPWVLALFTVLFALVAGLGWWTLNQRRHVVVPVTSRAAFEAQQRLGAERALLAQTVSRAEFDRLSAQVHSLAADHKALNEWVRTDYQSRQAETAAPMPVQSAAPAVGPDGAAAAFADWCRQGTPMMSRVDFFSSMLGTRVPGASARAVYRDLNSQAEPIRFDDRGGASPAEFWLVSAGGETLLFPQPLNAGQFRELTRVFDGTAAPKTLGQVVPARVRDEGGTFALAAPGRVS